MYSRRLWQSPTSSLRSLLKPCADSQALVISSTRHCQACVKHCVEPRAVAISEQLNKIFHKVKNRQSVSSIDKEPKDYGINTAARLHPYTGLTSGLHLFRFLLAIESGFFSRSIFFNLKTSAMLVLQFTCTFKPTATFPKCFFSKPVVYTYLHGIAAVQVIKMQRRYLHYSVSVYGIVFWFVSDLPF